MNETTRSDIRNIFLSNRQSCATIEEALGNDAAAVLPSAIRIVELQARIPPVSAGHAAVVRQAGRDLRRCGVVARAGGCGLRACRGAGGGGAGIRGGDGVVVVSTISASGICAPVVQTDCRVILRCAPDV